MAKIGTVSSDSYYDPDYFNDFGGKTLYNSGLVLNKDDDCFNLFSLSSVKSNGEVKSTVWFTKHQAEQFIKQLELCFQSK